MGGWGVSYPNFFGFLYIFYIYLHGSLDLFRSFIMILYYSSYWENMQAIRPL